MTAPTEPAPAPAPQEEEPSYHEEIVRETDIQPKTQWGWVIVESFMVDEPMPCSDQIPNPPGQYPEHKTITRFLLGKSLRFRIRRLVPLAKLEDQVKQLEEKMHEVSEQARVDAEALKREKAVHEVTTATLEAVRKERDNLYYADVKLRADLDKIREHIGRRAFDEIIEPGDADPNASDVERRMKAIGT